MTTERDDAILTKIVSEYGTPCYVFFEERFSENVSGFSSALKDAYPNAELCYAAKANFLPYVMAAARSFGANLEVTPGIELDIASKLGILNHHSIINGLIKANVQVGDVLKHECRVNVESYYELEEIARYAQKFGKMIKCGIRVKTDEQNNAWSRFGFSIDSGEAEQVLRMARDLNGVKIVGLHFHSGTNNNDPKAYGRNCRAICSWAEGKIEQHLLDLQYLDLGGGFSSACALKKCAIGWQNPEHQQFTRVIADAILESNVGRPLLILEPGRRLVDDCFYFLSSVVKSAGLSGERLIVDGSMTMFPSGVHRAHPVRNLTVRPGEMREYGLYGSSPIHFDCFYDKVLLNPAQQGDILVFENAGAYSINMEVAFSSYLPAVVSVSAGQVKLIRRRQTVDDILAMQVSD